MDVGVFSNPIQGLCKLNGTFKLPPSTPTPNPTASPELFPWSLVITTR